MLRSLFVRDIGRKLLGTRSATACDSVAYRRLPALSWSDPAHPSKRHTRVRSAGDLHKQISHQNMEPLWKITKLIESKRKTPVPWRRQEPFSQPYYSFSPQSKSWETAMTLSNSSSNTNIDAFSVLSWNIDFMLPFTNERMSVALSRIQALVSKSRTPSIIFFQEMLVTDLQLIQSQPWVQQSYYMTDIDDQYWESGHYGTCTLIPKSLNVASVFRVHYETTKMERDGLFVDVAINDHDAGTRTLRLCNTHLESLVADPPLRPAQVETSAKFMHGAAIIGSVMAGDFNAIQPFDRNLHLDNKLKDAYLELGGTEDSDNGYTWGQMAPVKQREMFGCSRMDKLFFCGQLKVEKFERFGMGVAVSDEKAKQVLMQGCGLEGAWVTDHLGVMADFKIANEKSRI